MDYENVFLIGDKPSWCRNVIHIHASDKLSSKTLNAWRKITLACTTPRISSEFTLMNDDFLILKKVHGDVPYYYRSVYNYGVKPKSKYFLAMKRTHDLFKNFKNYELHVPIIYNKSKFLALHDIYPISNVLLHRSLYANHYECGGVLLGDNKVSTISSLSKCVSNPLNTFVSLSDRLERDRSLSVFLKSRFRYKSKYEI